MLWMGKIIRSLLYMYDLHDSIGYRGFIKGEIAEFCYNLLLGNYITKCRRFYGIRLKLTMVFACCKL